MEEKMPYLPPPQCPQSFWVIPGTEVVQCLESNFSEVELEVERVSVEEPKFLEVPQPQPVDIRTRERNRSQSDSVIGEMGRESGVRLPIRLRRRNENRRYFRREK